MGRKKGQKNKKPGTEEKQHEDESQEKKKETPSPSSSRDVPPMVSQVTEQKPMDAWPSTSSGPVIVASTSKVETMRHKQTEEQKYAYGKQQFTTQSHKKQIYKKGQSGQEYQFPSTSTKYQPQIKQIDSASGIPPAEVLKMPSQKRHTPTSRDEKSQGTATAGSIKGATRHQTGVGDSSKKIPLQTPTQQSVAEQGKGFELSIPHRKAQCGTKGRSIQIETNHLPLIVRKFDTWVHYDVTITPDTPKRLLRKVMEEFRMEHYKNRFPVFDGTKNLYSSTELPFGQHIAGDVTVCYGENPKSYKVNIKFAKFLDPSPLKQFMTANSDKIRNIIISQEIIQCLDIVLRSAPALTCLPVGRNYFTPPREHMFHLGDGMEMYHGFYQSAIIGWKPFLNIDVAHKAFPACQNVIDLILEMCDLRQNDLQRSLDLRQVNTVDRFIRTLKVRYEIPGMPSAKREYRVNGLEKSARAATFKPENQPEMTVESYFNKQRNINLKYPQMPCLWVGKTDRVPKILLPAEFCTVIEGQVINRKLPEKVTSTMIRKTATSTKERKDKIMGAIHKVRFNENPCVREFGISVSEEFLKINGRVLVPPNLKYNKTFVKPTQGSWRPDRFLTGVSLTDWTIVNLDRYVRREALERMAEMMCSQASKLGMNVAEPQRPYETLQFRNNKELQDLQELFKKKKDLQLLIVVVPNKGPFYSYVKQAAELAESGIGCLTQCIRTLTVSRINVSTIINILQKINAKLEGINHVLNDPVDCMNLPYLIMGADVTHPGAFAKDKPSVAAVTASCDLSAFRYNICWRLQPPRVEIIEDLEAITREQLLYFYKNTGEKPVRIIFFRDGVSEGQFPYVLNTELQAIRRACSGLHVDYKPKITFLVVQKRHHTRFFPVNPQDTSKDRNLNVPVGTCVDTEITHPTDLDFYLLSHASIQGVARPTKYRVLWDDADMNHDDLQELAFYLCHMFSRCTRSVSYPAPTYYAHLAAARIIAYCETRKLNMNNLAREQDHLRIEENIIKGQPMFFV